MHRAACLLGVMFLIAACGGGSPEGTGGAPIVTPAPTIVVSADPAATPGTTPVPPATAGPTNAPPPTEASATAAPPTAAPPTEPPATPPPPTAAPGLGVPIQIAGQQTVTIVSFEAWPGTSTVKPAKGKIFRTVYVRIDAVTFTTFDSADFKLRDDGSGKAYAWRPGRAPHLYSSTGLGAGQNYEGWITYEVPKAAEGPFILVYRPAFEPGAVYRIPLS
jgi:hypothetical protein